MSSTTSLSESYEKERLQGSFFTTFLYCGDRGLGILTMLFFGFQAPPTADLHNSLLYFF